MSGELPGGRPEPGESERSALVREVREELGLEVEVVGEALDRYDFSPVPGRIVAIVTYACAPLDGDHPIAVSEEHIEVATFPPEEAVVLPELPVGYRTSIRQRFAL